MGLGRKALRTVKSMGKLSSSSSSSGLSQLESPVPQLLVSNYPPTDTQVYQINQAIAGAETLLLSLEYNGGRPKQCEACKEFIRAHTQTLSISRRIPPEIWQEVFLQLIPSDPQIILPIRYWIASTQVCRTWRVAGLSLPELWSFVPPVRLSNSRTEEPRFVASLNQFLSRSIPAPLRIRIDAPFREYTAPCSHPALDALVKHVERWEYLQIDTGYETYRRCFTSLGLEGRFASLRYLHIDVWRCYNSGERLLAFQNTPKLEEFSVHGVHPFAIDLPWNQLKVYTEKVENLGGLMTVLTRAKNLEKLEVTRVTAFLPDEFAELPILKTLYLRYDSVIPPDTVLLFLVAPKLEDLQIIGCEGEIIQNLMVLLSRAPGTKGRGPWPVPDFAKTRHRTLRRLAFRTKTMTPGNLAKLLRLLPYLEELDISQPPGQDVERLVIDPSGPSTAPLVPNLKKLYIHSDGNWGDEDTYRRLAQSRCEAQAAPSQSEKDAKPSVVRLETFRIVFENPALCSIQQAALEGWFDPTSSDPTYQALISAKTTLTNELPELLGESVPMRSAGRGVLEALGGGSAQAKRLNSTLGELEALVVRDVHHIYRSELHFILRKMSNFPEYYIPGDDKHCLRERAAGVLKEWKALFEEDITNKFRWVRVGKHSLVYIPSDHKIRQESDAIEKMVYGTMEDDIHKFNLFWHRYM